MSYSAQQKYDAVRMFAEGASLSDVKSALGIADYTARQLKKYAEEIKVSVEPFVVNIWDIETTDFKADIGQLMVSSFLDLASGVPDSRNIHDFDGHLAQRERQLAEWTINKIRESDILIGHNIKSFDRNFLNGVAARHGLPVVPERTYIDTYLIARYGLKGKIGGSMANLADVLGLPLPKDAPSKNDWRLYIGGDPDAVARITTRCELDVVVNAYLWQKLRPYYYRWRGEF